MQNTFFGDSEAKFKNCSKNVAQRSANVLSG
jgi:hypothetical protein